MKILQKLRSLPWLLIGRIFMGCWIAVGIVFFLLSIWKMIGAEEPGEILFWGLTMYIFMACTIGFIWNWPRKEDRW